jgi:hypothetical protein
MKKRVHTIDIKYYFITYLLILFKNIEEFIQF